MLSERYGGKKPPVCVMSASKSPDSWIVSIEMDWETGCWAMDKGIKTIFKNAKKYDSIVEALKGDE